MRVIYALGKINNIGKNQVLIIGVFDGLHLGHQKLIKEAKRRALLNKTKLCVMSFYPHPMHVLHPQKDLKLIMPLSYRLQLFKDMGVDSCIVLKFTKKLASLRAEKFITKYVLPIKPKEILIGSDFRFGNTRIGKISDLRSLGKKYKFKVASVTIAKAGKNKISSTDIRKFIEKAKFERVRKLLGRNFSLIGKVEKGLGVGKSLGFPTVNIYPHNEIVPVHGVYAVKVWIKQKLYYGMSFVGPCPKNIGKSKIRVEAYIFNFNKTIYEHMIRVEFVHKIREIKKFFSKEKLIARIKRDEVEVKKYFNIY